MSYAKLERDGQRLWRVTHYTNDGLATGTAVGSAREMRKLIEGLSYLALALPVAVPGSGLRRQRTRSGEFAVRRQKFT